jgi:hypothetical protein
MPPVLAGVAIVDGLVIMASPWAGRCGRHKRQHRDLLAAQELFDDHLIPGGAKGPRAHDLVQGLPGLGVGGADDGPLARRQAAGLDDDGRGVRLQISEGGVIVGEHGVGGGGRRGGHESLLNALEDSNRAAAWLGPKARRPRAARASLRPNASGPSGPMTTRSKRSASA